MAVIGDEDTCTGFLLGGIGEINKSRQTNFMVVDKDTATADIEEKLNQFIARKDIGIILISQSIADVVRHIIDSHKEPIPSILEIPSKDAPYDPSKDSILRRAKGMFSADDFR